MRVLVIEKAAVKQNIRVVKRRAGGAAVYGVLSGDAGGAGIAEMAELLRAEGIGRFAVSEAEEAEALRKAGFVDEEILMLRSTTDREVLDGMKRLFDGVAQGATEYLAGVPVEALTDLDWKGDW